MSTVDRREVERADEERRGWRGDESGVKRGEMERR